MRNVYEFIEKYKRLSIIGMEKNVGKTTLLNKLINDVGSKKILGITSIGRDGEDIDVVTSTDKPRIYIRRGSIIATGRDCLSKCDITKEILYVTDFTTPMGDIVIIRALSDGYVDIAGPSYNKQVKEIISLMENFGSELTIIDGALSRKSTAISDVSDATILATGAALSLDMLKVVEETKKTVNFLMLEDFKERAEEIKKDFETVKALYIKRDGSKTYIDVNNSVDLAKKIKENLTEEVEYFCIRGAITEKIMETFIETRGCFLNLNIIVEDGTKFFIDNGLYNKAKMCGIKFKVLNKINLLFITCNPHSPLGIDFNKNELKKRLEEEVSIPVIDVVGDENEIY
ncbi:MULTISPECIES: hypothetical protein [Fusobacterium]|uniref:lysine 5,6-aminomutase reactivase subunit KamB n=1 Tax=Fusobacterium TaxID=848 RepID=UPI0025BA7C57|nr:hypothetical protein [Fusobacterium sp.]MDD7391806.1 hypothetical protein [Fusobacteriaceae bacterium]MDY5713125.1 hypothetical protein [Fusobacterium gastrosuis]MCI5724725.1 hypothetical protein [Fusobacterium sp.]MCI7223105.1 hypothetical protein [Fusobacterium sp.]MDD7410772.1 hypothetical protein [Fusobacteriaceae bacterium]